MNLKQAQTEKKRIGIEEKGRVPDPWNHYGLPLLVNGLSDEVVELRVAVSLTTEPFAPTIEREAVICELADVANFVEFIEKRLVKLGWLDNG